MILKVKQVRSGATIPKYQSANAAGMDLHACVDDNETFCISPGMTATVNIGIAIEIPHGYEGQIRSRSGLAAKNNVHVLNSPGTIDSDYRGELKVILHNSNPQKDFIIRHGDRVAQLVIAKVEHPRIDVVEELSDTERGSGGFGSTGVSNGEKPT